MQNKNTVLKITFYECTLKINVLTACMDSGPFMWL